MGIEEKFVSDIELLTASNSNEGKIDFGKYNKEIVKNKEIITYLKDYSKIQVMAKLISESVNLKESLDEFKNKLEQDILTYTEELQSVPKITLVRPRKGLIGQYKALEKNLCDKKNETMRAQRSQRIADIKAKISDAKSRLKTIKDIEKMVSTPRRVQNNCLDKIDSLNNVKYRSLVDYCYKSLSVGPFENDFLQNSGIFYKKEDGSISVNEKKARSLISVSKNEKSVTKLVNFFKAKENVTSTRDDLRGTFRKITDLKDFLSNSNTNEMKTVIEIINSISEKYYELCKKEEKASRGNVFTRTIDFIKRTLNMDDTHKSVIKKRKELSKYVRSICQEIEENDGLSNALIIFSNAREATGEAKIDIDSLKDLAKNIIRDRDEASFITHYIDPEKLKFSVEAALVKKEKMKDELLNRLNQAKATRNELYQKLSKRDLQILEKYGESGIKYVAGMFFSDKTGISFVTTRKDKMVPTTAISILEGIVNRRKTDFASSLDSYAKVFGEEARETEFKDMNKSLYDIIETIKNKAKEVAYPERRTAKITPEKREPVKAIFKDKDEI